MKKSKNLVLFITRKGGYYLHHLYKLLNMSTKYLNPLIIMQIYRLVENVLFLDLVY